MTLWLSSEDWRAVKMGSLDELLRIAREQREKYKVTSDSTEAEKLMAELRRKDLTRDECLELEQKINNFFDSDAPEEDKKTLSGYTESLVMICNAIREEF
jgi:hypothetical protein